MYKIEFTLKQHTPLIHFQHDQEGATLRATEVKPKLDRYLDCFSFDFNFEEIKKYLTGYTEIKENLYRSKYESGYNSLDYKINIRTNPDNIIISEIPDKPNKFPCFFGNMGDDNKQNPKKFSFTKDDLSISFSSNHLFIIEQITKEIPNFFARNNFGTRQGKGFGSFYISEEDVNYEIPNLLTYFIITNTSRGFEYLFKEIETVHKVIRSGINDIGKSDAHLFYLKPLIWKYFKTKGINWDKRAIKKHFYYQQIINQENIHSDQIEEDKILNWPIFYDSENYKMIKDLLGLSSQESWRRPYNQTIKKESDYIERMKSPVFYKPIMIEKELRVYIDNEQIPDEFYSKTFLISNGKDSFNLTTPEIEEFKIDDFLRWALYSTNIKELIGTDFIRTPKAKRILGIFDQLKKNFNV